MLHFSIEGVAPKLASLDFRNAVCETVSGHGRIILGIVPLRLRSFHLFLDAQMSWQAQQFVNLHAQITWHAQHFMNLHVQNSWQAQAHHFANLHVQSS